MEMRGGVSRRLRMPPSFAAFVLLICAAACCLAAPMELVREARTVAGQRGTIGHVDGPPGVSLLFSPQALCSGRTDDEILIGEIGLFRTFSRSSGYTGTLFGSSSAGNTDGSWDVARLDQPHSCVRTMINGDWVVYFVEGKNSVRYIVENNVGSVHLTAGTSFVSIALHGEAIYMVNQNGDAVWSCTIGSTVIPRNCRKLSGFSCSSNKYHSITVTGSGVFIVGVGMEAKFGAICWFTATGTHVFTLRGAYTSITSTESGALYASTSRELHHLIISNNKLVSGRFVGSATTTCPPSVDGFNPVLCQMRKLHVIAENEMYVTTHSEIMQSITLPPVIVSDILPRQPLPVGYPDADTIMPKVVKLMNEAINLALSTSDTAVDVDSLLVDDETWRTNFSVLVQQSDFDNATTTDAVLRVEYTNATRAVEEYYNKTDEVVYTDTSIVPYCDDVMLRNFERGVVGKVRTALEFPLVYSNQPKAVTINKISNITSLKLLIPATFANDTTKKVLTALDLSVLALDVIRELYSPDHRFKLVFPEQPYDYTYITEEQMMSLRWILLDMVRQQLDICATATGGITPGKCHAVITNRSVTQITQPPFSTESVYEVFVPDRFTFSVSNCLNDIDWAPFLTVLRKYNSITVGKWNGPCDRTCVIILAVVAALVLTALIVLLVVFTSKRRRLAAVVAPSRPKFTGTLDDGEREMATENPLERADEFGRERRLSP